MLNIKRRCHMNLNDALLSNNNNVIRVKREFTDSLTQKFCLQHNNCNCSTPEVCFCQFGLSFQSHYTPHTQKLCKVYSRYLE